LIGVKGLLWVNYPLNGVTNDTVRIGLVTDAPPDRRLRVFCAISRHKASHLEMVPHRLCLSSPFI